MKSSEIIELAIECHLMAGEAHEMQGELFSCSAVRRAHIDIGGRSGACMKKLYEMGCTEDPSIFSDVNVERRQYARALWLTFAAHVLREEGD